MILVLGLALIITYIASLGMKVKEGMTNSDSTADTKSEKPTEPNTTSSSNNTSDSNTDPMAKLKNLTDGSKPEVVKDGMDIMSNKKSNRIDYASTVEDAYDDLNKILGSDGMQRLTNDTHKLM